MADDGKPTTVEEFFDRYPCDSRAQAYLTDSSQAVIEKVFTGFSPKREGEDDYSALLVRFVKGLRQKDQDGRLDDGGGYAPRGRADAPPSQADFDDEFANFIQRFPLDEAAEKYLLNSPPEVQTTVLRTFQPPREGESDYSALLISFTKRCRQKSGPSGPSLAMHPEPQQQYFAPPPAVPSKSRQLLQQQANQDHALQDFADRYPMDQEAMAYLTNSSLEVQDQVIQNFKPKREGESDYSAIIISFCKRCRQGSQQRAPPEPQHQPHYQQRHPQYQQPPPAPMPRCSQRHHPQAYQPQAPQRHHAPSRHQDDSAELDHFRRRFPMDDRAFGYLLDSPPDVRRQVLDNFTPKRLDDTDYSAPVVAFTKVCRSRPAEQPQQTRQAPPPQPMPPRQPPQRHYQPQQQHSFQGTSFQGVAPMMQQQMQMSTSQGLGDVLMADFCQRYPMDQGAQQMLLSAPPTVAARVLREFKPKREGDSDYSAVVVSFIQVCKREAGGGGGGGGGWSPSGNVAPWHGAKRPRLH